VFRRIARFVGGGDLDIERLSDRPRLGGGLCEKLSRRRRRGGEREMLSDTLRPLRGGVIERDTGRPFRLGGVMDRDNDLDIERERGRPRASSLPLPFRGGVLDMERLRSIPRGREYDRDLDFDEPLYDE
jgi:hypothetical protein